MLTSIDWIVLSVYLAVSLIAGLALARRANSSTEEYFLSGRSLPWWLLGTSIVATSFSSDTPLYVTNLVRKGGVAENWQWWSFAIGGMLGAVWLAPLWRRAGVMTDVELTELRYSGKIAGFLRGFRGIWLALLVNSIGMGWVMLGMAKITYACFGWDKLTALALLCGVTFIYTLLGGLWGAILTDFVQYIIAQVGAIVLAVYALDAVGGTSSLLQFLQNPANWKPEGVVPANPIAFVPSVWGLDGALTAAFGAFCVYAFVQWWANLNSDGGGKVIQRLLAAKNEGHALGGFFWYNIANYAIRTWPWVIVALVSLKLYPTIADPEMAYPQMMVDLLPAGVLGLMLASFLAAFMSTVTSQVNWGASYLLNDVYRRFLHKTADDKHYLRMAWVFSTVVLLMGALAAYLAQSVTTAFQFVITLGSGVGPVYLLRWLWWRINATSELAALLLSTLLAAVWVFVKPVWATFAVKLMLTAFPTLIVAVLLAYLTKPTEMHRLREFYLRTRPPGWWKPVRDDILQFGGTFADKEAGAITLTGKSVLIDWFAGLGLVLGLTFGIGWFLFLQVGLGIIATVVSAGSGWYLWNRYRK
ncbi:MAG: Na+:solute symporter [bacterium]|nr:Na+:solute symporter [bacterium]